MAVEYDAKIEAKNRKAVIVLFSELLKNIPDEFYSDDFKANDESLSQIFQPLCAKLYEDALKDDITYGQLEVGNDYMTIVQSQTLKRVRNYVLESLKYLYNEKLGVFDPEKELSMAKIESQRLEIIKNTPTTNEISEK